MGVGLVGGQGGVGSGGRIGGQGGCERRIKVLGKIHKIVKKRFRWGGGGQEGGWSGGGRVGGGSGWM